MVIKEGKTNVKYLLIVVILAAIVGGLALWCSIKQEATYQPPEIQEPEKVDGTVDWKTYRNEEYGFEFKYPKEYDECEPCKMEETDNVIELDESRITIEITKSYLSLLENVNEFVCRQKEILGMIGLSEEELAKRNLRIRIEEIFVGNNKGFEVTGATGRPSRHIFLSKDDKIYRLSCGAWGMLSCLGYAISEGICEVKDRATFDVFNQILSTFRFLE